MREGLWTEVTTSEYAHERAGLDYLRRNLPDREPYRAWSNFTFIAEDGSLNEVDCLVVTPTQVVVVEIKSYPGKLEGDPGTWYWTPPDGNRPLPRDNPLPSTNLKAKRLKSTLLATPAFADGRLRRSSPWFQPVIFLSSPNLTCLLDKAGRTHVYGLDPEEGERVPDHALPGIIEFLTHVDPRRGRQIDRPLSRALTQAVDQAGIRERVAHRQIGPYELGELLAEGEDWQDYLATHTELRDTTRRLRIYLTGRADSREERQRRERAARREFRFLQTISHPQIARPLHYETHDRGAALVFDHDPNAQRLDHYLLEHGDELTREDRLGLVRSLAEALRHAHHKGLYHRALTPETVAVTVGEEGRPTVVLHNWQTATREATTTATSRASGTRHVSRLVAASQQLYLAPETRQVPDPDPRAADLFSLGALAILILTGRPPAGDLDGLHALLAQAGHLTLAAAGDAADSDLDEVIQGLTKAKASARFVSVDEFLEFLDEALQREQKVREPEEPDPFHADVGDMIGDTWLVERRFAQGSTGVVFQVYSEDDTKEVLKVARDQEAAQRLRGEADVLRRPEMRDRRIIRCHGTESIGGRTILRLEPALRTLARELEEHGRVGLDLLERWGCDLIEALDVLEEAGVAHRDIKPDNLGVIERGKNQERHLVLFDFSLAKADPSDLRAGTQGYIDPFLAERTSQRWDIHAERYAAGVTLYEMATGMRPTWGDGSTSPEFVDEDLPNIDRDLLDGAVAEPLTEFFERALRRDPARRFGTASAMLRAWRKVFAGLAAHDLIEEEAGLAAHDVDLTSVSPDTLIAELDLAPRLASALQRLDITTLDDLRAIPQQRLISLPSIGAATRREITHLAARVRERFPDAGPPAEEAGHLSVDRLADVLVPKPPADVQDRTVTEVFLGLGGQVTARWPSQRHLVEETGLSPEIVADTLTAARRRWSRRTEVTAARNELARLLADRAGVGSGEELADALLATRGTVSEGATRRMRARAVIRAAVETELTLASPKYVARRVGEGLLVALDGELPPLEEGEDPTYWSADALIDAAVALGDAADELAGRDPVPTAEEALAALRAVAVPEGVEPFTDARLVRLAGAASRRAAVSSRLEIYRAGLDAQRAVTAARAGLIDRSGITPQEVKHRIRARFPQAQELPDPPALTRLLEQADTGLTWDPKEGRYELELHMGLDLSSLRTPSSTSYESPDMRDLRVEALEERLARLADTGGYLVLTVHPRRLDAATRQVAATVEGQVFDLDGAFIKAMRSEAEKAGADWQALVAADRGGRSAPHWSKLQLLINRVLPHIEDQIRKAAPAVVLHNIGLLVRYERLDLLDRLASTVTVERTEDSLRAVAVIVPGDDPTALPAVDGAVIPVLGSNQWNHVPRAWLEPAKEAA